MASPVTEAEVRLDLVDAGEVHDLLPLLRDGHIVLLDLRRLSESSEEVVGFAKGVAEAIGARVEQVEEHVFAVRPAPTAAASDDAPSPYREYIDRSVDLVRDVLLQLPEKRVTRLINLNRSPEQLAGKLVAALPLAGAWDERIGPFYDTSGLARWRGVTRQGVHKQAKARAVLAVQTTDGTMLYPAFQFDEQGASVPALREVLLAMDPDARDPWGDALWLNSPAAELGGRRPIEVLRSGAPVPVLSIARRIGAAWRQ